MRVRTGKAWWLNVSLLVLGAALAFGVSEAVVRAFLRIPRGTPYVEENQDTVYFSKPLITGRHISPGEFEYTFHTNSRGLRSPEIEYERSSKPRILCLGDSFTFGIGASDDRTWPAILAQQFRSEGAPVEVVNGGVMGWGLAEYLIWLEREGRRYEPNLVVVGVHASDWENASNGLITVNERNELEKHTVIRKDVRRLKAISDWIPFYQTLMTESALANYLKRIIVQRTKQGSTLTSKNSGGNRNFEATYRVNELIVRDLHARIREVPADVLFVFIPTYAQVVGDDSVPKEYQEFRETILRWAEVRSIPMVDMVPVFQNSVATGKERVSQYYHLLDGHNTARGYELIAKSVFGYLRQHPAEFPNLHRRKILASSVRHGLRDSPASTDTSGTPVRTES